MSLISRYSRDQVGNLKGSSGRELTLAGRYRRDLSSSGPSRHTGHRRGLSANSTREMVTMFSAALTMAGRKDNQASAAGTVGRDLTIIPGAATVRATAIGAERAAGTAAGVEREN